VKDLYDVILKPLITEKGTKLKDEQNKITLEVALDSNKIEIKRAVEALFKVKVEEVATITCKGKRKRTGARQGQRSDWKKAIVTLREGEKVEYLDRVG